MQRKKNFLKPVITGLLFFVLFSAVSAQTQDSPVSMTSGKYQLFYDMDTKNPQSILVMLNDYFTAFSNIFHFDNTGPGFVYTVRVFSTPEKFNDYLVGKTGNNPVRGSSTFLKYSKPEKSEVLFIAGTPATDISRQLSIQYIYSYIKEPPAWLLGGSSLLAENIGWTENTGVVTAKKVHPWLDTAKRLRADSTKCLTAENIMKADKTAYSTDILYPQAWLLIEFFNNTGNPVLLRLLPETLTELRLSDTGTYISKTEKENKEIFTSYMETWSSWNIVNEMFNVFAVQTKSIGEMINQGISLYTNNKYDEAAKLFSKVIELEDTNSTAAYYMGLIDYAKGRYTEAESWYQKALEKGADKALINWALGAAAYSERRFDEAIVYLKTAASLSPDIYGLRVQELIDAVPLNH